MASGLILFFYITSHLVNHALGLVSLETAEAGMSIAVEVWYSLPGTAILYGAFAVHFMMALVAVYERRTLRLPPLELIRIALGFSMPVLLIGHVAATRLAYDLYGLDSTYTRVVANLWASGQQGWQLGLLAPGWLHGCLGLHFAFNRRPWFQRSRLVLFSAALLLPVLSGLGFIAMGRELAASPAAVAASFDFFSPTHAAQRLAIFQWKESLLNWYFSIIVATFIAREIRNLIERRRKGLIEVTYPGRTVNIPRGWSVLEASRSFHLPHAAMCGGRARCSTCRVRVSAGAEHCPPPAKDEQETLARIGAPADVRLACQLRPYGSISVVPVVRTARPIYRAPAAPQRGGESDIVVLYCDFSNRADLMADHLPQDLLYVLTIYVEGLSHAIRASGGTISSIDGESVCALFGVDGATEVCAQRALQAAGAIEGVISDLNNRLGRQKHNRLKISVVLHAGRAAIGEVGTSEPPMMLAIGEAADVAGDMRKLAADRDRAFAISERVYRDAGLMPVYDEQVELPTPGSDGEIIVYLSDAAPIASPAWTLHGKLGRGAMLKRLWAGG
jgi:adenylate cyclase